MPCRFCVNPMAGKPIGKDPSTGDVVYMTSDVRSLPPGAVPISDDEFRKMQIKRVMSWTPKSEMWALLYGNGILSGAAAVTGVTFNHHFRKLFKLGNLSRKTSFLPAAVIPVCMTYMAHCVFVLPHVVTGSEGCAVCMEVRANAIQATLGWAQPCLLALLSCSSLATLSFTYIVPPVREPQKLLKFYYRQCRKLPGPIALTLGMNVAVTSFVIAAQQKAVAKTMGML